MYSQILLPRQWARIACYCRSVATIESQKPAHSSTSSDGISAPVRIPRGPTDILQALAATVGPDPTAAHYKYHDDPYLIPLSNFRKRSYALAAEAGRKAAAWIRDEHADLFTTREWDPPGKKKTTHFNADPCIDVFAPKPIYNDESKVTEEDFKYTLQNALLEDAIKVFELLGGVEALSDDMKIDFLQLLCFYNEKEPLSMEWLEERWFSSNTRERQIATWRLDGLANNIFTSMEPKAPEAYCAIIQGMAKYYQAERAHELAQEAIEKGIPLSTGVFNSLLSCIGFLKEGTTLRIEALKNLLNQMNEQGLSPDNGTLTSCLQSISAWGGGRVLEQIALQIVAEFKEIGIYPGLSAYYYLLCLFCKERGPRVDILSNILNDLEKREKLEPDDAMDTKFFITAMGVCSDHLQNVSLAERVHKLLMKDDNYKLVGDAYKESIYYRHYITINCRHAPFEKTLELLDTLVPNVYVPEPSVIEEIIKTLEVGGAGQRLAQTWSQLVVFGQAHRTKLVERLLDAFCNCYQYQDEEVKSNIRSAAADILRFGQLKEEREEVGERRSPMQKLSATAVTNIVDLCSDVKDKDDPCWEQVGQALDKLRSDQAAGVPARPDVLVQAAKRAAAVGKPGIAAMAVTYLADYGFDEALTAGVQTLSLLLNRTQEEVETLLQEDKSKLSGALHPSALVIAEAYITAKTGTQIQRSDTSSSDSDSDEFSDDD